jgi:integrase
VSIHARPLSRPDAKGRRQTVYDVRLRDANGTPYKRTFAKRAEAKAFEAAELTRKATGSLADPRGSRRTVAHVAAAWLASDPVKRDSSKARDASILRKHVLPAIGARQIGSISRGDIQGLVNGWTATHAASSVGRMYSAARALFSYADIEAPFKRIKVPKAELVERPYLAAEQLSALADELGPEQAAFMWTGVVLGLRWAEVAGLTVADVDPLRATVRVSGQLTRDGSRHVPKTTAGARVLSVPAWLVDILAAVMAAKGLTGADAGALVFTSSEATPVHYSNWRRRVWVPACERARLAGLRFHDLRSMAATALIASGTDVKTTQTRLGHANPQTTLALYARATADADRRAADAVGDVFRPAAGAGGKTR